MVVSRNGKEEDLSKGIAGALEALDKRIAEMKAEEQQDLFNTEEARKAKAEESRKAVETAMLAYSGIPERYHGASLKEWATDDEKQTAMKPKLVSWLVGLGMGSAPSAVWFGPAGTGKTHLACGMLQDRYKHGLDGLYITAKGYTDKIKNSYREDSKDSSTDILERYGNAPVLVLDEVGRQFEAKSEELYFFELVNERYNHRKPTLFLSNLTAEEFRTFAGVAIMDRLREGGGVFHAFNWASRRV